MKRKELVFKIGEESVPIVLEGKELNNSPFGSTVRRAADCLTELYNQNIINDTRDQGKTAYTRSCYISSNPSNANTENWQLATRNNILTFLGDRGTGKTSCMRTVISICRETHPDWMFPDEIDPSFFDDKHNILDIFIGVLYGIHKIDRLGWDKMERAQQNDYRSNQEKFKTVKSALRYIDIKAQLDEGTEIDELTHLNEGAKLRILIKDLIDSILSFHRKKFMVISIDDLDLNIPQSYLMMELIRKFLILPNVAIIIAAKYHQLFDSICLVLTGHYKGIEHRVSQKDISEMAERYLNKMFPLTQRFEMPSVESYLDATLRIEDNEGDIKQVKEDESGDTRDENEPGTVKNVVPTLIFDKTRYLFYNSSTMASLVIPRNLRDLRMLIGMLYRMKPFEELEEEEQKENQRRFKSYFFQEWIGILDPEYRSFAKALLSEENPAKINRFVIENLYSFFLKDTVTYEKLFKEIHEPGQPQLSDSDSRERILLMEILNPENSYWNVSVGDVVTIIDYVRKIHDSSKSISLLFFIETFYSMKLYESYNTLTATTDATGIIVTTEKRSSAPELKTTVHGEMPEYFRFVGGSLFSPTGDFFIPASPTEEGLREFRLINGQILMREIRNLVADYKKAGFDPSESEDATESDGVKEWDVAYKLSARLRLCEFFMLTVAGRDFIADNRRLVNEPLYFKSFGTSVKNLMFDVTAPFLNAMYPELAYGRFNNVIYKIALKDKASLLNRMIGLTPKREKENDSWELMSKVAIRNMEILEDLTQWMHGNREKIRPDGKGLQGALRNFYSRYDAPAKEGEMPTTGYCVKTYTKTDGKKGKDHYLINYSVYGCLGEVMNELLSSEYKDEDARKSTKERNAIFDAIMSFDNIFVQREEYNRDEVRDILRQYCGSQVADDEIFNSGEKSISLEKLAEALVDIRLRYRYEFANHLPPELKERYKDILDKEFESRQQKIDRDSRRLNEELKDLEAHQNGLREQVKGFAQDLNTYRKDSFNLTKEINTLNGLIETDKKNIDLLQYRLHEPGLTKAEYTRISKELEKAQRLLHAHEGEKTGAENNQLAAEMLITSLQNGSENVEKKLSKLRTRLNEVRDELVKYGVASNLLESIKKNSRALRS